MACGFTPPQTSVGLIPGPGTGWDFLDSDSCLPAGSLRAGGTHLIVLIHDDWTKLLGMQRGFCPPFSHLTSSSPLQDTHLKLIPFRQRLGQEQALVAYPVLT